MRTVIAEKMKIRKILLLILLHTAFAHSHAQSKRIPFDHIGVNEGLSESNILTIIQDSRGFMWFGSWDGLNRYDGYKITVYKNIPGDSLSISNNYINCVAEDATGNLWVATNNGLNYFNRNKETFKRFKHIAGKASSIIDNNINSVLADQQGIVWIGTNEGLERYDPASGIFQHIVIFTEYPNNGVDKIFEDSRGNLWICHLNNKGISVWNKQRNSFTHYRHTSDANSLSGDLVNDIFEDSEHKIWIGTNGNGLDMLDARSAKFLHHRHDANNPESIAGNVVLAINEDEEKNLWVSTENSGLSIWNKNTQQFNNYTHDEIDKESISNNSVYCIYKDNKKNMWLANFAGWVDVAMSDKKLFTHYKHSQSENSLSNNQVLSIMEDRDKKIWIGTDGGGLNIFNPSTGSFERLSHQKNNGRSLCGNYVLNTMQDSKGNIWAGTWIDGISLLSSSGKIIRHFKHDDKDSTSISNNNAWKFFEDSDKNIWIGTYGGGLNLLNPDGKSFTRFFREGTDNNKLPQFLINIYEDKKGLLWLSTEGNGLFTFNRTTHLFKNFRHTEGKNSISSDNVNSVFEDSRGKLWIATMNGLDQYDPSTNQFYTYTTAQGLAGDYVFGILEDEKYCLWISTNKGISCFNPSISKFFNYGTSDGLQSNEFKPLAVCKTSSGMMYMGGINGFNRFLPSEVKRKSYEPPVVITSIAVSNKLLPISQSNSNTPLKQSITETSVITFPFSDNALSFEFASLNYTNSERKKYFYQLKGFDKTWIEAGTARTASYTNLDPGEYEFQVKGVDNEGNISAKITTLQITILPPFWLTWWCKLLIAGAVSGSIFLLFRFRLHRIKRQKILLEKKVNEQTKQLRISAAMERKARQEAEAANIFIQQANKKLTESEQRYSKLFYESPQPKFLYDIDTLRFTSVNKAATALYGYTEEEFLLMTVSRLNGTDHRHLSGLADLTGDDTSIYSGREKHIKKNGEEIDVDIHSSVININGKRKRMFIALDVTDKIRFENKMNRAIIKTQEEERYEIGSELHDNICQILASSQMNISMLNNFPQNLIPYYENSKMYLKLALDEIRNLSHRLAPAFCDERMMEETFRNLAQSINTENRYDINVYFYKTANGYPIKKEIQLHMYRILQEQLRNIIKHARATDISVDVMITPEGDLVMHTADNGIGFQPATVKDGIGLVNMKRRVELFSGNIDISSSPGNGCNIRVSIPLNENKN